MATTATGLSPWDTVRVALDATAGNLEAVTFPAWCRTAIISFYQSDNETPVAGWIDRDGTDGAPKSTTAKRVDPGEDYTLRLSRGRGRAPDLVAFLAANSNSAYAHIEMSASP